MQLPSASQSLPLLTCSGEKFQAFLAPDSFHSFMVDGDAFIPKHGGHHPVSGSTVVGIEPDDLRADIIFIATFHRFMPAAVEKNIDSSHKDQANW